MSDPNETEQAVCEIHLCLLEGKDKHCPRCAAAVRHLRRARRRAEKPTMETVQETALLEARRHKVTLERRISDDLMEFSREHGLYVTELSLDFIETTSLDDDGATGFYRVIARCSI